VRESDFYADREGAIKTITDACEDLGIYSLDHVDKPAEGSSVHATAVQVNADARGAELPIHSSSAGEDQTAEADVSIPSYGPFSGYSEDSRFPDPREASPANVRTVLRQIIEEDGPLTRSCVYRLYVEGCPGLQRVGRVVRQALNRALGAMLRAGEIVQEDELGEGSPESQVIRLAGAARVRERPAGRRDLLEIPPSELVSVLGRLVPDNPETGEDEETVFRRLLDHYGFSRLTKPRRDYLSKVLRLGRPGTEDIGATDRPRANEAV